MSSKSKFVFSCLTKDEFPMSEKILIDAPCTGTGVIGRRPDIKWRIKNKDIHSMSQIQGSILNHMSRFLKNGGNTLSAKIRYGLPFIELESIIAYAQIPIDIDKK